MIDSPPESNQVIRGTKKLDERPLHKYADRELSASTIDIEVHKKEGGAHWPPVTFEESRE